nr:Chain A, Amyloid beta A4 protein [Homo sapiens]
NKGAII